MKKDLLLNPRNQYIIGLIVNLLYLLILVVLGVNAPIDTTKIVKPFLWQYHDDEQYILLAKNFLHYGVFGQGMIPDDCRTIGYPFLVSAFMYIFKSHWVIAIQIFQCFLTAALYPLFTKIIRLLFNKDEDFYYIKYVFIAVLITGVVFSQVNFIMTDIIFTTFLYLGLYLGILTYERRSVWLALLYIAVITYASVLRPNNGLFPVINIVVAFFVLKQNVFTFSNIRKLVLITSVLLVCCNLPSIRNYINNNNFQPSRVIVFNLMGYFGSEMARVGNQDVQDEYFRYVDDLHWNTAQDLSSLVKKSNHDILTLVKHYPKVAVMALVYESSHLLFGNYILKYVGNSFGYDIHDHFLVYSIKASPLIFYGSFILSVPYGILWLLFILALYELVRQKQYWLVILVGAFFMLYMFPALFSSYGFTRYRLTFEFFFLTLPIRYLYRHRNDFPFRRKKTV